MTHVSNICVLRAANLINRIKLDNNKEYNLAEIFIDFNDFGVSENKEICTQAKTGAITTIFQATKTNILDKIYVPCVKSRLTETLKQNKSMTTITNKLEDVHTDFWGPYDPFSQSENIYTAILICKHICKIWTLYLKEKDDFVDTF